MKPHIHAAVIHAFADGAEVQVMTDFGEWKDCQYPDFDPHCKYQVKPAAPKWPQTTMTYEQLETAYSGAGGILSWDSAAAKILADAAIAHACETSQVIPADVHAERMRAAFREGEASVQRSPERDMAIAINVRAACHAKLPGQVTNDELKTLIDLAK